MVPPDNDAPCVVYTRVSSWDQREDLDRQVGRVVAWATEHRHRPDEVVKEIGSGLKLNGSQRRLQRIVGNATVGIVMVEQRDQMCRLGFEYVEAPPTGTSMGILVVEDEEIEDDLVRDVTEALTSLYARLYGKRSARRRSERAVAAAAETVQ